MRIFLFGAFLLVLFSCSRKSNEVAEDMGYNYYPLTEGNWYVYDVEVTKYHGSPVGSDSSYQMKEVIMEPVTELDETRYQLYRYYRKNSSQSWKSQPDSVWTVFRRGNQLVKVEDNVRYVKLSFPVEPSKTWDGNSMNDSDLEKYTMKDVKRSFTIPSTTTIHNPTVTVLHSDKLAKTEKNKRYDVYAENIGLVYRHLEVIAYCQENDGCTLGTYIIHTGTHLEQRLNSYGTH
jgi:hypothetical protein